MEKRKGIYWYTHSEKKNVMKCDIYGVCGLSFQNHFGNIFGSITIDQFFKLFKTFHKIYSAKILNLLDILSVYYLQATELFSRSIWEKYSAKILGRNTHLAERTFTGTKYRRFKDGIPVRLQYLTLQYYTFSSVVLFLFFIFLQSFFKSFLFPLSSVCNVSCLFEISNAEKKHTIR